MNNQALSSLLDAFRVDLSQRREASFAFSTKSPMPGWTAYSFSVAVPFFFVVAQGSRATQIYSFASGINKEAFILLADLGEKMVLVVRRPGKEGNPYLRLVLQKQEDFERATGILRKLDLVSDSLTAHAHLSDAVELLRVGAERHFVNLGLFSNYFLRERMVPTLSERGRRVDKESNAFFSKFGGEIPVDPGDAVKVLSELGYKPILVGTNGHPEYRLLSGPTKLDAICVVAKADSLDTKKSDEVVPSYQAVSALKQVHWVILTNGRLWRLYSSRVSSSSTNYLEIDLEGITTSDDPKLGYFVSLFSSASLIPKAQGSDLDAIYEGGLRYAQELKDELSSKVFEGQLFLNLVRAVISHSPGKKYREDELEGAKTTALRLLYRILFILYAESRNLLPVNNQNYAEISLERVRRNLPGFERQPGGSELWQSLRALFRSIENGNVKAGVPVYDGELFREVGDLDGRNLENKHLVPAIRELTEIDGKGIDYHDLGVRQLGSLYEGLLEYSVLQAEENLVVYKDGTLDAAYAADMKAKPKPYVSEGELYLSAGGLARKGTGSYYTPDEIVRYLAKNGLHPILELRQRRFESHLAELNAKRGRDIELEKAVINDLLGIKVVDPAMGSGHFLVAVVEQITSWIMDRLKEHPEAPLARMIDEDREMVISDQRGRGIQISTELLTDNIILKRLVMKRCVYGVDINPLAVELAKLSLWLDSFTIGTPLTFLDHHVRCGDSLIGLWLDNIKEKAFEQTLDTWTETITTAGVDLFWNVSSAADLTVEEVDQSRKAYQDVRGKTEALRILLDLSVASVLEPALGKRLVKNYDLIEKTYQAHAAKPSWWGDIEKALSMAHEYKAFHWEFEFPDAYSGSNKGFDLVLMNPPWDVIEPQDDAFFSMYFPRFRRITSKLEKQKVMENVLKDSRIRQQHERYKDTIDKKSSFYRVSGEYVKRGSGKSDSWKLFLERGLKLLSKDGSLSVVIPSGIVTDEGGKQLREALFEGRIRSLFEFENRKGIFEDVHRSYKFVLLIWDKASKLQSFPAAFYLHDIESLEGNAERAKFVDMPMELVRTCAPESLSIPEVRNNPELAVFSKLYQLHPLLGDEGKEWSVSLIQELNRSSDSDLFRTNGKGWPLIEGKNFHQFLPDYEKITFTIDPTEGISRASRHSDFQFVNEKIHKTVRLAFRDVASSTNVRSTIACILPPKSFTPHTAILVFPKRFKIPSREYCEVVSYLCAIFNSFVFDFLVRTRVSTHLSFFYIYQTPVPSSFGEDLSKRIITISSRLSASDSRFDELQTLAGEEIGPLPMRRRIELTAELNAAVAKHYDLNESELKVILGSFDGFEEDENLAKMEGRIEWSDHLVRKFNGEVRNRVIPYYRRLSEPRRNR